MRFKGLKPIEAPASCQPLQKTVSNVLSKAAHVLTVGLKQAACNAKDVIDVRDVKDLAADSFALYAIGYSFYNQSSFLSISRA
jgi:hypothetical protein